MTASSSTRWAVEVGSRMAGTAAALAAVVAAATAMVIVLEVEVEEGVAERAEAS